MITVDKKNVRTSRLELGTVAYNALRMELDNLCSHIIDMCDTNYKPVTSVTLDKSRSILIFRFRLEISSINESAESVFLLLNFDSISSFDWITSVQLSGIRP